jgi:hypothetical protein
MFRFPCFLCGLFALLFVTFNFVLCYCTLHVLDCNGVVGVSPQS